jgi:hypothetical protein
MNLHRLLLPLAVALVSAGTVSAQQPTSHDSSLHAQHMQSDSAYAAVQRRGQGVMGVDQYTSTHVFESLPDGGRIELQRNMEDTAGVAQIRRHLTEVVHQFEQGDFSAPFLVHDQEVPGTAVMRQKRAQIHYKVNELPRGGEIRMTTHDAAALSAIHDFLAFQRSDHRAGAH